MRCEQGHRASVTFITHRTLPRAGMPPRVTPLLGRNVCEVKMHGCTTRAVVPEASVHVCGWRSIRAVGSSIEALRTVAAESTPPSKCALVQDRDP
jgi:hypothetical protein